MMLQESFEKIRKAGISQVFEGIKIYCDKIRWEDWGYGEACWDEKKT